MSSLNFSITPNSNETRITDADGRDITKMIGITAAAISIAVNELASATILCNIMTANADVPGKNIDWTILLSGEAVKIARIQLADGRIIDFTSGIPSISG